MAASDPSVFATNCEEVGTAAQFFRLASHPMRLKILLELVNGEREPGVLSVDLGYDCPKQTRTHLATLLVQGLIIQRVSGRQNMYSLSGAGQCMVSAYAVVHAFLTRGESCS